MVVLYRNLTSPDFGEPFWGTPTATVDWCEINYENSKYIAEYHNTLSSFLIILVGFLGSWLHPWQPLQFHIAFLSTSLVGFGSVLYHSTLLRQTQALDEVPMLFSGMAFFFICIDLIWNLNQRTKSLLSAFCFLYSTILGIYTATTSGGQQFLIFHISFGLVEVSSLIMCCFIYWKRRARGNQNHPSISCFKRGIFCYISAVFFWMLEVHFCEYLNPGYSQSFLPINPQFHTFWHALVSLGLHHLALMMLIEYLEKIGTKKAQMNWLFRGIPYIKVKSTD